MSLTLNGRNLTHVRVHIPAWGAWYADASIDAEVAISGPATIVLNDLTLKGTVLSGGVTLGRADYRIVGGAGGLGKVLPALSYANDAGVKLTTVLGDAMRGAGETLDPATVPATRVGPAWTRPAGIAGRVLEQLAPSAWYVREDGAVCIGARAVRTLTTSAARVTPIDQARRRIGLAAETLAQLVPGVVVDGLQAVDVVHSADAASGLRTMIYGKGLATSSKLLDAWRKLLEQLDPDRVFRGAFEYRVVSQSGNRVDLQPVLVSTGMPDLQRVPVRPGVSGARSTLALGSRVLVTWVNSDPSRPVVVGFEDADGEGFRPPLTRVDATALELGASPGDFVALASLVNARLAAMTSALNTHVHDFPPTSAIPTGVPLAPFVAQASVASAAVKCT